MTMTYDQRQARAIQKAAEQKAHVWAMPGRPGFFTVRSATDATEKYVVAVSPAGEVQCSCRAAAYQQPCWHAERLRSRLIREAGRQCEEVA